MMIAGFSDGAGRRPAYLICLTLFLAANIGLALQNDYAALMVLRCLQSGGSSGTIALATGLVGDLATSAERGTYVAWASVGGLLGPSIAPIIGGLLSQYLGWKWIFWFSAIFAAALLVPTLLFLPETCRKVVADDSVRAPKLNWSVTDALRHRARARRGLEVDPARIEEVCRNYRLRFPNPLSTLALVADKESGLVLLTSGLSFVCFYAVMTGAAAEFRQSYGFDNLQISLMFVPIGAGSLVSAVTTGRLTDRNYRRHAKKLGLPVDKDRHQDLANFPLERARIEVDIPTLPKSLART